MVIITTWNVSLQPCKTRLHVLSVVKGRNQRFVSITIHIKTNQNVYLYPWKEAYTQYRFAARPSTNRPWYGISDACIVARQFVRAILLRQRAFSLQQANGCFQQFHIISADGNVHFFIVQVRNKKRIPRHYGRCGQMNVNPNRALDRHLAIMSSPHSKLRMEKGELPRCVSQFSTLNSQLRLPF